MPDSAAARRSRCSDHPRERRDTCPKRRRHPHTRSGARAAARSPRRRPLARRRRAGLGRYFDLNPLVYRSRSRRSRWRRQRPAALPRCAIRGPADETPTTPLPSRRCGSDGSALAPPRRRPARPSAPSSRSPPELLARQRLLVRGRDPGRALSSRPGCPRASATVAARRPRPSTPPRRRARPRRRAPSGRL